MRDFSVQVVWNADADRIDFRIFEQILIIAISERNIELLDQRRAAILIETGDRHDLRREVPAHILRYEIARYRIQ